MLSRIAPYLLLITLGFSASSSAFYGPLIAPQKPNRLVLQAVAIELQPGHETALASPNDFRQTLATGTDNGWAEELGAFHGRVEFFGGKQFSLPDGGSIEIRPRDRDLPGRVRFILTQWLADGTNTEELLTIRLDHRVGFEEGYAVVPLEGKRRFLALAVELRR